MSGSYLFNDVEWFSIQSNQEQRLRLAIANLSSDRILNTPVEDLCDYFDDEYHLSVPVLDKDNMVADQREKDIDVSNDHRRYWSSPGPHHVRGTEISLTIAFAGDGELFKVQPTSFTLSPPYGEVSGNNLILRISGTQLDASKTRQQFDRTISQIESYLTNLQANADAHNQKIKIIARQQIEGRRTKLLADQNLVSQLGFPLKQRADSPRTYAPPEVRKRIKPPLPPQSTAPFKPEPALTTDDYEHIITVIDNMAQVMERSPSAFKSMDEESLRSHFLVQLNGHYEGNATGETFNYSGKTDILLRAEGRNIFIAECKYWSGPKKLLETIDQLLSYSSWRDTKTAIIVFNQRKNFTSVLEAITPTIKEHKNFKRELQISGETKFRFVLSHRDDPAREMIVTVLLFDVPNL